MFIEKINLEYATKHFIIPDTLTTKSIKIGLQSKEIKLENTHPLDAFHCSREDSMSLSF